MSPSWNLGLWGNTASNKQFLGPPRDKVSQGPVELILPFLTLARNGSCVPTLVWRSTNKTRSISCAHWQGRGTSMCQK